LKVGVGRCVPRRRGAAKLRYTAGMESESSPLLQLERLGVSFANGQGGHTPAVRGVDLTIYPRQTVAVVGESGSGKSVTALSTLRLVPTPPGRYDSGRALWRDARFGVESSAAPVDLLKLSNRMMRRIRGDQIAMIFQEPMTSLNPVYTIGEQIMEAVFLHQRVDRRKAREIAAAALEEVGIGDPANRLDDYPHQLSGGMRQRVMIAMALACRPRLLLADEPTTALDVTIQAQILELLRALQREHDMAVMLITHDLGVVAENADVVAVMFAGRVVEYADVVTLFRRPLHPYTRGLLGSMPRLGERKPRLPTVTDGATIPEDLPSGVTVRPHRTGAEGFEAYGDPSLQLHEIEDRHWVLCERNDGGEPTRPDLPFRRETLASSG